jgi:hypothetical protein
MRLEEWDLDFREVRVDCVDVVDYFSEDEV